MGQVAGSSRVLDEPATPSHSCCLPQFIKTFGQCLASVASNVTKSVLLLPPLPSSITPQALASAAAKAQAANQSFYSTATYINHTVNQLVRPLAVLCV